LPLVFLLSRMSVLVYFYIRVKVNPTNDSEQMLCLLQPFCEYLHVS
jgi:hypothetical protein